MAPLVTWRGLEKAYGAQVLFDGIDLGIEDGERIGLIGPNGSGKSTFMKILAGLSHADAGEGICRKLVRLVYLPQEEQFDPDATISEILDAAAAATPETDPEAYGLIRRHIGEAGFVDLNAKTGTLSGGWLKRVSIVKALVQLPDLLLMDEPTNHLDLEGILWLEQVLSGCRFALVAVSHDRRFLGNTTDRILELGRFYPDGYYSVRGDYDLFREKKAQFLEQQERQESRLANRMRQETEWLRRSPKARTTKAQFRVDAAYRLEEELSAVKYRNRQHETMSIAFDGTERKTRKLVEVYKAGKQMGEKSLFSKVSVLLSPGTRLGLVGRNGTGKSTFMRMLAGEILPDAGSVKRADGLRVVYFDQARESIDPDITLKKALSPEGDSLLYRGRSIHVVTWAKKFLFKPEQMEQPVGRLSGGERARILIANLMREPADVLLLDEPTNDLDIPALEVLEESLRSFSGAVVLVSHDRYLMRQVCERVLGFAGNGEAGLYADIDQWLLTLQEKKKMASKPAQEKNRQEKIKKATKLSYKLQLELDGMEEQILIAEEELSKQTEILNLPETASDPETLAKVCLALEKSQQKVDALFARWEELEALRDAAQGNG